VTAFLYETDDSPHSTRALELRHQCRAPGPLAHRRSQRWTRPQL